MLYPQTLTGSFKSHNFYYYLLIFQNSENHRSKPNFFPLPKCEYIKTKIFLCSLRMWKSFRKIMMIIFLLRCAVFWHASTKTWFTAHFGFMEITFCDNNRSSTQHAAGKTRKNGYIDKQTFIIIFYNYIHTFTTASTATIFPEFNYFL